MKKTIYLLSVFLFYFFPHSVAHADVIKTFGGSNSDYLEKIIHLKEGGYVTAGYSYSSDGDIPTNHGSGDAVIVKYDDYGNKIWTKVFGGSNVDYFYSVVETNDGGFIAVGESMSSDGDLLLNKGGYDAIIVKFDKNGNKQWAKSYGGNNDDNFSNIVSLNDGNFILIGSTSSTNGDFPLVNGSPDGLVIKIDGNGNIVWIKHFGGSKGISMGGLYSTQDGGMLISGGSQSSDGDFTSNKGGFDAFLLKLDSNGNKIWLKSIGGTLKDSFNDAIESSNGNYYAVGSSYSSDGDIGVDKGKWDAIIAKFDSNGNKLWVKDYGGNNEDQLISLYQMNDGSFISVGYTGSTSGDFIAKKGGIDALVLKFDSNGNMLHYQTYGGSKTAMKKLTKIK